MLLLFLFFPRSDAKPFSRSSEAYINFTVQIQISNALLAASIYKRDACRISPLGRVATPTAVAVAVAVASIVIR